MISICIPFHIVDLESEQMTLDCIESFKETMKKEDEIVLVDDASPFKHSIKADKTNRKPLGNAGVWNQLVKLAKHSRVLLSDNDIRAMNWREPMLKSLDKYNIVFPLVYNESIGKIQRHLAGECFIFRKEWYNTIGGFDEIYGSYFEDTDWFMRTILAGGKLGVADNSLVSHRSQGTFKKIWSPEKQKAVFDRNKLIYEKKFNGQYPYLVDKTVDKV